MGLVSRGGLGRWHPWIVGGVMLLMLGSCRAIAGLHDVTYLAADGACATPVLPAAGNGRVRLVNGGTQGGSVDFCLRVSGASDWGSPVLSAGPAACDTGLTYAHVTVPFAVPAGAIDVEAVPVGSSCDVAATSQAMGVAVGDSTARAPVVTLVRYGGGTNPEHIAALSEEPPGSITTSGPYSYALRLVNAVSSGQAISAGFAASKSLPTTIPLLLLPEAIAPGGVEPPSNVVPGFRAFDAQGYSDPPPSEVTFAVVLQSQHNALFTFQTSGDPDVQTLFAIGDSGDDAHPIRGLLCEDATSSESGDAGGGGGTGILAACTLSDLPSLAVDTFNTGLYGGQAAFNDERRSAVYDAIAGRPSDLMCLIETSLDADAIVQHASGTFPYSYFVRTDLDTQPTDPTDAEGNTPPPPTGPPCAGIDPSIVSSIYQCSAQNCTNTGDLNGYVATTNCLSASCAGPITQLYYQGQQQDACVDCIIYYANAELPLSTGLKACTSDPRQPFSSNGMNATLMLSRYPLINTQAFILPGTGFRRVVLYAQVKLEDQVVDFFCGHFVSPLIDGVIPYVGNYGVDIPNQENGWEDEQILQARKIVPWIKATTTYPAIIAGDWHATALVTGTSADGGTTTVLADQSRAVMQLFDQSLGGAFLRAEPDGYKATCEYCPSPQNVYNVGSGVLPEDFTPTFLKGFPPGATVEDSLWGMNNTVPLTSIPDEPAPAPFGPISIYYGRLLRVLRPPVHN